MITLKQTCGACPEAYDGYDADGNKVAYLRLRYGNFFAECAGVVVYEASTKGDGIFQDDERHKHLSLAVSAIEAHLDSGEMYPENYTIE